MVDIPEPLRAIVTALHAARQAGDAQAIASLCSEDAIVLLPGGQRLAGRAAIAAGYPAPASGKASKAGRGGEPNTKFYFFPPLVHALATINGRHGEKHSLVDIYQQQADASYLLAFSSSTLR